MNSVLAILTLIVLLTSSYGWGFAVVKWVVRDNSSFFSFLAAVGFACLIVLGGTLNLIGMAYPLGMQALLLPGLFFFLVSISARFMVLLQPNNASLLPSTNISRTSTLDRLLPIFFIAIAIVFFAATLLPTGIFNMHDDFHTYIPRPLTMLQTGTLNENPYELLGIDSLGAQAFLQGFFLLMLPVGYLPGLDAVFGLGLAGLLLTATAQRFDLSWIFAAPAILVFLVINPQSVNVSALYTSALAILGLLFTSCLLTERFYGSGMAKSLGLAVLAGLFIASLVALKTTMALFAAIYYAIFCLGLLATAQNKRHAFWLSATTCAAATIAISPWLLLHLPNYATALDTHLATASNTSGFPLPKGNLSELLSTRDLFYGGSLLGYGSIIILLAVLGIFSIMFMLHGNPVKQRGYSLVSASACAAAIATFFLNGVLFDPNAAIRYICPVLIATLPFALLVSSHNAGPGFAARQPGAFKQAILQTVVLAGAMLVIALFGNNFADRVKRAYSKHTTISLPINVPYIQYNSYVLSEDARQSTLGIQLKTEPGKAIFAWISTPLHLDFARNKIFMVMEPGLTNPWLNLPLNGDSVEMAQFLKRQGIRYIMWEYQGTGMKYPWDYERMLLSPYPIYRRLAERNLYMRELLTSIMADGPYLYLENGIVLFDLDQIN